MPEWKSYPSTKPSKEGFYIIKDFTKIPLICYYDLERWFCGSVDLDPRQVTSYCDIPRDNWKVYPEEKPTENQYLILRTRVRHHLSPWTIGKYIGGEFIIEPFVEKPLKNSYVTWAYVPTD